MCQGAYAQTALSFISDTNFRACLNEAANRNGWNYAEQVTSLSCSNRGIVAVDGVQNLPNLNELDLSNNKLINLCQIGQSVNLARLNLAGNQTNSGRDLNGVLSNLIHLTSLNLNGINLGSISNLNGLVNRSNGQPA